MHGSGGDRRKSIAADVQFYYNMDQVASFQSTLGLLEQLLYT
jgi:hypothetical protein